MEKFEQLTKTDYMTSQPPISHVCSYEYCEPNDIECYPKKEPKHPSIIPVAGPSKSPSRNSIRSLFIKGFQSKTISEPSTSSSSSSCSSRRNHQAYGSYYGTHENLYEEVDERKIRTVLSDNQIVPVKEELKRVQNNHFRVLDELNLSLEALIMPPTSPDISPTEERRLQTIHEFNVGGVESNSRRLDSMELKEHTCYHPVFNEGDLDSGFSGSGSSSSGGASCYNENIRFIKTGSELQMQATTLPHMQSCCLPTTSNPNDQGLSMLTASALPSTFRFDRNNSGSRRYPSTK